MANLIDETDLSGLFAKNKKQGEIIFPELVQRLILASKDHGQVRIPTRDSVWAPGYDGILNDFSSKSDYVPNGNSVWEFGTNEDYYSKINGDYYKRSKGSDFKNKQGYTFILCTSKIWSHKHKTILGWCEEKNAEKKWKEVKVYDAVTLAAWLDEHPDIVSGLYSSFKQEFFARTLTQELDYYNKNLTYHLKQPFFINSNVHHREKLFELLDNKARVITIKSPYGYDHSLQFTLGALDAIKNDEIKSSILFVNDSESLRKIDSSASDKVIVQPFFDNITPAKNNVHIILLRNSDINNSPNIVLDYCYRTEFVDSLILCGIDSHLAYKLSEATGNNPISLVRKITDKELSSLNIPGWVKKTDTRILLPLSIMGTINFDNESDNARLASFDITNVKDYKKKLGCLLSVDDSPIIKADNSYSISSREEVFQYCKFDEEDVNRIYVAIEDEISKTGDKADRKFLHNSFDALLWINSLGLNKFSCKNSKLIRLLLQKENIVYSLDFLRYAAELDRVTFINSISMIFENGSKLKEYFNSEILANKYRVSQFLFSFDVCGGFKDTSTNTIDVLLKIYDNTDNEEINNRLLLYLNPISAEIISLSVEERKKFISRYAASETSLGNLCRLFPGEMLSYWIPYSAKRTKEENNSSVKTDEINLIGIYTINLLIDKKYNLETLFDKLVNSTDFLPIDECHKIFVRLEEWIRDLNDEEKAKLKPKIIREIQATVEFSSSENWKARQKILPMLKNLLQACEPTDVFLSLRYLFNAPLHEIPIVNPIPKVEENYHIEENEEIKNNTIAEAIEKIRIAYGNEWWKLIFDNAVADFPFSWNVYEESNEKMDVIHYLIENKKGNYLSSILYRLDDSKIIELFKKFNGDDFVKSLPIREAVLSHLNEKQEETYWSNWNRSFCKDRSEEDFMFEKLIKYNPTAIVQSHYFRIFFNEKSNRKKIIRTLTAIDAESKNIESSDIVKLKLSNLLDTFFSYIRLPKQFYF